MERKVDSEFALGQVAKLSVLAGHLKDLGRTLDGISLRALEGVYEDWLVYNACGVFGCAVERAAQEMAETLQGLRKELEEEWEEGEDEDEKE